MSEVWAAEQVAELVRMRHEGMPQRQIAEVLGVTRSAVSGRLIRMGLKRERSGAPDQGKGWAGEARKEKAREYSRQKAREQRAIRRVSEPCDPRPTASKPREAVEFDLTPLAGSSPRPYTRRLSGECTWPVIAEGAETHSCCLPIHRGSFCEQHARRGYYEARK